MRRYLFSSFFLVALYSWPAHGDDFNFEEAAAIEGTFRSIVRHCADEQFAQEFVSGSKAQVAFTLQGEDQIIPVSFIENMVQEYERLAKVEHLTDAECESLVPRIRLLHESRTRTLLSTQEFTSTIAESARDGS